ncbi:MAG: hypothetical protein B0D92_08360 [Spirochaeta sp. LUC14_002_19_P3]|nr:MAG: hypothetical protein B0D92_08360 [Spirochaeta sp. LUC14_002_19_P3]
MVPADKPLAGKAQNSLWYIALIIILAAALVIWAFVSLKIDIFTEALKQKETVSILIVIDDEEQPLLSNVMLLNPKNLHAALIALPKETGMLLSAIDKVDRLEVLYDVGNTATYAGAVGELLGRPIDFTIRFSFDNLERFVDLLGGLDIFIPKVIDDTMEGTRFLFPPGSIKLDGAKACSYVRYYPAEENLDERTDREQRVTQSLLRGISKNIRLLLDEEIFPFTAALIGWNHDQQSLRSLLTTFSEIYTDRLILQSILGSRRKLSGKNVLFPFYDGKLVKETIQSVSETLVQSSQVGNELLTVNIEILNGTKINGLASRTAHVFNSYGFRVVSVSNADRDDYERTVVLDRRGDPKAAQRVAELIHCEQFFSDIEQMRDETIDVTVILGKDFGGRYVK